jgi:hypothetical protein
MHTPNIQQKLADLLGLRFIEIISDTAHPSLFDLNLKDHLYEFSELRS